MQLPVEKQSVYLPLGPSKPAQKHLNLLEKLGFDLSTIKTAGRYYHVEPPKNETGLLRYVKDQWRSDIVRHTVFYGDVKVISVSQKTAFYDSNCFFNIYESKVDNALKQEPSNVTWGPYKEALEQAEKNRQQNIGSDISPEIVELQAIYDATGLQGL